MNAYDSDPMDAGLLQLERELFSLTPSAPPREMSARIEEAIFTPVSATTPVSAPAAPRGRVFLHPALRRAAVPAAAAAAAVIGVFAHRSFVAQTQIPVAAVPDQTVPQPARRVAPLAYAGQRQFVVFPDRPGLYEVTPQGLRLVHASFADTLEGASPTVPDYFDPRWLSSRPQSAPDSGYRLTPASLQ